MKVFKNEIQWKIGGSRRKERKNDSLKTFWMGFKIDKHNITAINLGCSYVDITFCWCLKNKRNMIKSGDVHIFDRGNVIASIFSSGHLLYLTGNKLNLVTENSSNREVKITTSHGVITWQYQWMQGQIPCLFCKKC